MLPSRLPSPILQIFSLTLVGKHVKRYHLAPSEFHSTRGEIWNQYNWPQHSEIGRSDDLTHREHFYRAINSIQCWTHSCRLLKCRVTISVSIWLVRDETIAVMWSLSCLQGRGTTEPEQRPEKHKDKRIEKNEVMDLLEACGVDRNL